MSKTLGIICALWLCGLLAAIGADASFPLADGTMVSGTIVSYSDNGIIFRTGDDKYTDRLPWIKFSQSALKQFAQNPKIDPFVEPFILPAQPEHPPKAKVNLQEVSRLDRSGPASLFGGVFSSPIGLMVLLLIYAANIYAGYEVALFRARPAGLVAGVSAALPVIGPVIFLMMPSLRAVAAEPVAEEEAVEAVPVQPEPQRFVVPGMPAPAAPAALKPQAAPPKEEIHIVTGSWEAGAPPTPPETSKTEIFQRGQFMFNRRFFETKFSGFFGIVRREADKDKVLQIKTAHALFVAERISRISANEVHFEVLRGDSRQEVPVQFTEILEVQLKYKNT